jgi:hypothetical protein
MTDAADRGWRAWFPWPIGTHWCWYETVNVITVGAFFVVVLLALAWEWLR